MNEVLATGAAMAGGRESGGALPSPKDMAWTRALLLAGVSILAVALTAGEALSADKFFQGTFSDDWFDDDNWWQPGTATAADYVYITQGAARIDGQAAGAIQVYVTQGNARTATLVIENGGTLMTGSGIAYIGQGTGSNGHVTVRGTGSRWDAGAGLRLGELGIGRMDIEGGGAVTADGIVILGQGSFTNTVAEGILDVSGTGSGLVATSSVIVGGYGRGTLTVEGGGTLSATELLVGNGSTGQGAVVVTGAGSSIATSGIVQLGLNAATMTVADGGTVTINGGSGVLYILDRGSGPSQLNIGAASGDAAANAGIVHAGTISFSDAGGDLNFNHLDSAYSLSADIVSNAPGNGRINVKSGRTILSGDSSNFSGSTTIDGGQLDITGQLGGVITVNSGGIIGGIGTLDNLVMANGGILAPGNSIGTLTVTGDVVLNDISRLNYEIGAPGSSDLLAVGGNLTLDGKLYLTDAGGAGIGHYRLMTYGTLTDNTLDVMTPYPVASATYTIQTGGGNVDLVIASTGGPVIGDPNLQYWQDNSATWTAAGTDWRNSGGDIDVAWAGNHGVFNGTGSTIAVTGPHNFKGLQFVTSGYTLNGPGTLQTVAGGSELRVLGGETATIAATLAGSGGISKTQGGTLILTGGNTYTGATVIEAGTLALQGGGSIASSAALSFARAGVLDVAGVTAGNTRIGTLSGVAGSNIVLGATDLTVDQATNGTFAGVISGDGGLIKTGIGELFLTGENTYAGDTIIDQGTLTLGNGGTSGAVAGDIVNNNSFLVFNRSDDVTYAGVLSGSGATSFIGSGMTRLTGDSSTLTGPVFVNAGHLRLGVGAKLGATTLTVGTNGTLSGIDATIIANNVNVEGRLAPGGENLGTLTVTGNVAFQTGSTYAVRIRGTDPMPSGQTVDSLSVSGTANLAGGTVEIAAIGPRTSYVDGHRYATPIVSAGDLGGTQFAGVGMASDSAFITPSLSYEGNDVFLTIAVTQDFTTAAGTFNQVQAAGALNGLEQSGDALLVFNAIANMNEDDARRAFDLISGEVHAAGQQVIDQTFALFSRTLRYQGVVGIGAGNVGAQTFTAPLGYGPAPGNPGVVAIDDATAMADLGARGVWAAPLGGFGRVEADGNAGQLNWWNAGLAGGYEGVIDVASGTAVGGFGFGYLHSRGIVDARLSSFDADGFYLGAYGAWTDEAWNLAGSLAYGANRVSTTRNIAFMGTVAEASYWTHTIGLSAEASYAFALADSTRIAPLFTLDADWSGHSGFTETGADALNLTAGAASWSRLDAGLGLALTHTILTESGKVTVEGRAVWEHAFADVVPSQNFALAGSPTSFTVLGPDAGRDRLRLGAGLSWDVSADMTLRARYDGLFSRHQANHAASLGLNVKF